MKRCACVAKRAIMYVFPFGLASWLCGTVFIDRSNAADSRTKISATAEEITTNKTKMWIFPEGTRSKGAELLPFKKGAFHIAVQHKLPIVPVVISPYTFINDEKKIFNLGKILR
jgi:lysophosphatidate acyltransferase